MNSGKKQVVMILKHVTLILALQLVQCPLAQFIVIIIYTTEGVVINLPGSQIYSVSKKKKQACESLTG